MLFFTVLSTGWHVQLLFFIVLMLYWLLYYLPPRGIALTYLKQNYYLGLKVLSVLFVFAVAYAYLSRFVLRVPSRMIILVVFSLSVFAGAGLDLFKQRNRRLPSLVLLLVFIELLIVNGPLLDNAFKIPFEKVYGGDFTQSVDYPRHPLKYSDMYTAYRMNKGAADCYAIINVKQNVAVSGDSSYRGEAYLAGGSGEAKITLFTPNAMTLEVVNSMPDTLVLNQNYYPGWTSNAGEVTSHDGLLSVQLSPGRREVTFYYLPVSFLLGFAVSILSGAAGLVVLYVRLVLQQETGTHRVAKPL
jgi:hypothetical protein